MFNWWKKKAEKQRVENAPLQTDVVLPDLKKKDKEEKSKTAGAALPKGKSAEIFIPARGGTGAASSAARSAASQAAAGAAGRVGASMFGNLVSGLALLGLKTLLIGLALVAAGGAGVVGYRMLTAPPRKAPLTLGSIKAEIRNTGRQVAKEAMAAAKERGMLAWIVPEAAPGSKAGTAASSGDSGAADSSGQGGEGAAAEASGTAGETDPTQAGGLTTPFGRPGESLLTAKSGVTSANFTMSGPQYGSSLGARLSKFDRKGAAKGKGGAVTRDTVVMSPSMGNIRHRMRDSRSLGRLRAMVPYNVKIKGAGVSATEAEAGAAESQFEGSENTGGVAPSGPADSGQTVPSSPGGGGGGATGCQCNWEKQTCVNNACVDINTGPPVETTPWRELTEKGKDMRTQVIICMILAAVFFTIGYYLSKTYVGSAWATIFMALGYIMALLAMVRAYQMIQIGKQINSMGGKPHGDQFINMGYAYIAGAVLMMAMAYFQPGWASAVETFAIVLVAIMIIVQLVGSMLK
ncbi:MAG: hypothetical protein HY924_14885 [Elusimicrobia bacterium]|nr:hypothetical protein [Elusimicrobiota bacterium]